MKIETESNFFNNNINTSLFKTKMLNKKFFRTRYTSSYSSKFCSYSPKATKTKILYSKFKINDKEDYKNNKVKKKNNNISRNIFNDFIKKKQLLLNNKSNNSSYFINVKYKKGKNKIFFKPIEIPFKEIKLLNIKKVRIKDKKTPLLNNNFTNNLLKNKSSFLQCNDKNINFCKSKTLNNLKVRKLNLKRNLTSCNINFFNDYEKEFFVGKDYSNLKYNEEEIYRNRPLYDNLIKEKLEYFKNNLNENKTIKLEKNIKYGKDKLNINITLNSLILSCEEMGLSPELQNKNLVINFPFALLPIFYYKGNDPFQKVLCSVIKVDHNFESFYFDDERISIALNNIIDYQTEVEISNIDNDDINDSIFSRISKNERKKPISLRPLSLQKSRDFLNFNIFIFFWITNTKNFIAKVTLPCISLKIVDYNITINQYLDYEFLFFLYKNNFLNWDYYIIRYLSTYSKFRDIFHKLGPNNKYINKTIYLKQPALKINTFAEEILYNIYTDQFNKNSIILFKSFYVIINFKHNLIYERIYHIYFSFLQYIKLYEIAKYAPKVDFLIKFLTINNDTHTLDFNYKEFDNFDIKVWMHNIKKYSEKSLKPNDKEEILYAEYKIYTKNVKIQFIKPQWTIIKFINDREVSKTWEIGKELEIDLVNCMIYSGTETWTKFLNECLKKVDEPVPVIPLSNLKKKTNKRNKLKLTSISNRSRYSSKSSHSSKKSKFT